MRNIFTNADMTNFLADIFKDNAYNATIEDVKTGVRKEVNIVDYLNIDFYDWWQQNETMVDKLMNEGLDIREAWKSSLNLSINKSYALVEQLDEESIVSEDIDGATTKGRVTFMINANKVKNLEAYTRHLKARFLGTPITIDTSIGDKIRGYLTLGILLYDQEPEMTQGGKMLQVSLNYKFSYMKFAETYNDVRFQISLDNTNFYDLVISKYSVQNAVTTQAVPTANRPDLTGDLGQAISKIISLTYFDFNSEICDLLSDIHFSMGAIEIDDVETEVGEVNIPIWVKLTRKNKNKTYLYKMMVKGNSKQYTNNEFVIATLELRLWGKVGA